MVNKMTEEYRQEIISTLVLWSIWSRDGLEKLTDRELIELYERHMNMG